MGEPFPASAGWDPTLAAYYRLALRTFDAAVPEAALFFIGAAAECVIEDAGDNALGAIVNAKHWAGAKESKKTEEKVRVVMAALQAASKATKKPDSQEILWLEAHATLFRQNRNEIGHPQATPPQVARHEVESRIRTFGDYVRRLRGACAAAQP